MLLHEIIEDLENNSPVNTEWIDTYKESLRVYFSNMYGNGELLLIVTDVFNAGSLALISDSTNGIETIDNYINDYCTDDDDIKEAVRDAIIITPY
jgi:hypothetical protein